MHCPEIQTKNHDTETGDSDVFTTTEARYLDIHHTYTRDRRMHHTEIRDRDTYNNRETRDRDIHHTVARDI